MPAVMSAAVSGSHAALAMHLREGLSNSRTGSVWKPVSSRAQPWNRQLRRPGRCKMVKTTDRLYGHLLDHNSLVDSYLRLGPRIH